jgi:hypothetical protein
VALVGATAVEIEGLTKPGFFVGLYPGGSASPAWTWSYRPEGDRAWGHDVVFTPDGGLFATGRVADDAWAGRFDADGNVVWSGVADLDSASQVTVSAYDDVYYVQARGQVVTADLDGNLVDAFDLAGPSASGSDLEWYDGRFAVAGVFDDAPGVAVFEANGSPTFQRVWDPYPDPEAWGPVGAAWLPDGGLAFAANTARTEIAIARLLPPG